MPPRDSWRALVVEDERFARLELVDMLRQHPQIEVVGEAESVAQARELLRERRPDVLLLDIQLGAHSGFELLDDVPNDCRVIFVTAHDAHAVRAFEVSAVDYLLKPVHPQRLANAIGKLGTSAPSGGARTISYDGHLFIERGTACGFVAVRDIRCVLADGDYSRVVVTGAKQSLVLRSLADWEAMLPGERFVRVHRSVIVNLDYVARMEPREHGSYAVHVHGLRDPLPMSRRYAARVRDAGFIVQSVRGGHPAPTE